ncbi:MAG: pantetheine-phosphate adenylyltransferase [Dehalococcoidia bacterium]|nr:pantetheine-phosphate adenylyltransferase [Dehalococcoidia bacterium]
MDGEVRKVVVALYPGRFDPVTKGHLDIAMRAAALFDELIIAIYDLPSDRTLFSTVERVDFFARAVKAESKIRVLPFAGLVVDFARKQEASVLVRGIRAVTGFETEFDMALMNKKMAPQIESVYLMASLDHLFLSGTRIREVSSLGYDVRGLVPDHVLQALDEKFSPPTEDQP